MQFLTKAYQNFVIHVRFHLFLGGSNEHVLHKCPDITYVISEEKLLSLQR